MTPYTPLSDTEKRDISLTYFSEKQAKSQAQEHPTIALVGGQPGAGKSAASDLVCSELVEQGGYIRVDADRMRERIPLGDSKPTSEQTQPDAGSLAHSLRALAIQGRRNIVEEGTFRKADDLVQRIQNLHDKGYRVELLAVATPSEESTLGIYQRHEKQHAGHTQNPRFVSQAYHDEAMRGFDATVAKTAARFDRVRVITRDGQVLYDSRAPRNSQANALEALAAGRMMPDTKLAQLDRDWAVVDGAATARGAPPAYLDAIAEHRQRVRKIKDERIHSHAMQQIRANFAALGQDPRYVRHSDGELAKAAYFRGCHEKAREIEGKPVNFKLYDQTLADRAALAKLPEVTDRIAEIRRHVPEAQKQRRDGHSL